jgi:hypothetical protein
MGKGKKKKKAKHKDKTIDLNSPHTITILVPDEIGDLDKQVLHGVGRLTIAATSPFDVNAVAVVKTSQLKEAVMGPLSWPKSLPEIK